MASISASILALLAVLALFLPVLPPGQKWRGKQVLSACKQEVRDLSPDGKDGGDFCYRTLGYMGRGPSICENGEPSIFYFGGIITKAENCSALSKAKTYIALGVTGFAEVYESIGASGGRDIFYRQLSTINGRNIGPEQLRGILKKEREGRDEAAARRKLEEAKDPELARERIRKEAESLKSLVEKLDIRKSAASSAKP